VHSAGAGPLAIRRVHTRKYSCGGQNAANVSLTRKCNALNDREEEEEGEEVLCQNTSQAGQAGARPRNLRRFLPARANGSRVGPLSGLPRVLVARASRRSVALALLNWRASRHSRPEARRKR